MSEVICAGVLPREVVIGTETTGLDARAGHLVVEIGCVELRTAALRVRFGIVISIRSVKCRWRPWPSTGSWKRFWRECRFLRKKLPSLPIL
jgi:hypothetical protein